MRPYKLHFKTFFDSKYLVIIFEREYENIQTPKFFEKADSLPSHIIGLPHLENLALHAQYVLGSGEVGIKYISAIFSNFINLTSLSVNLSNNYLEFQEIEILSNALAQLLHLQTLKVVLNFNKISNFGVEYLCQGIPKSLVHLDLQLEATNIEFVGVEQLSMCIGNLTKLESISLKLNNNLIGDAGVKIISQSLISLSETLTRLSLGLSNSEINDDGVRYLSNAICEIKNLQKIDISLRKNNLDISNAINITSAISSLPKLDTLALNLEYNRIYLNKHNELFTQIGQITDLKSLNLQLNNNYPRDAKQQMFSFASQLNYLRDLKLSNFFNDYSFDELLLEIKSNSNQLRQLYCLQISQVNSINIRQNLIKFYPRLVLLKIN